MMLTLSILCLLSLVRRIRTFDDPISAHPGMVSLADRITQRRRGLTNPDILSQQDKDDILNLHNKIRAETARGEYVGASGNLPSATNMLKLKWSDSLAEVASEWSSFCDFEHRSGSSSCANALSDLSSVDISEYSNGDSCGENLYGSGADPAWSTTPYGTSYSIRGGIEESWCINEAKMWIYGTSMGIAGHYTQCVWATTAYIGCGFYNCPSTDGWMKNMLTCNYYPPGNYPTYPYESGSAGSDCPSGYSKSSLDEYTDQDGEVYDLRGLCVDDAAPTTQTTAHPTQSPVQQTASPSPSSVPSGSPITRSPALTRNTTQSPTLASSMERTTSTTSTTSHYYTSTTQNHSFTYAVLDIPTDAPVIECNAVQSGRFVTNDVLIWQFDNVNSGFFMFDNCNSTFDSLFFLYDSAGTAIQFQATNECDGDDCDTAQLPQCTDGYNEAFTIQLEPETYYLLLTDYAESASTSTYAPNEYVVEVDCSNTTAIDNSFAPTQESTANPTSEPTLEPTTLLVDDAISSSSSTSTLFGADADGATSVKESICMISVLQMVLALVMLI